MLKRILAVVPVHNRKETTLRFLPGLLNQKADGFNLDVLLVDDGSTDGTASIVRERFPEIRIIEGNGDLWWAGGVNTGFSYALQSGYDFVYTVNDDIDLFPDTLAKLFASLNEVELPAVGSSVFLNEKGRIILAGWQLCGPLKKWKPIRRLPSDTVATDRIDSLSSKSTLIPTSIIQNIGYFDHDRFPHHYSDIDYFNRVKDKGYPLIVSAKSRIVTEGSNSNFHDLLLNKKLSAFLGTFQDIKYAHNLKTVYSSSTRGHSTHIGLILFGYRMLPYMAWIFSRIILPRQWLAKILVRTGRVNA